MQPPKMIYICAPRSGIELSNTPTILRTAERLRVMGFNVIEPVSVNRAFLGTDYSPPSEEPTYPGFRADIIAIATCCDAITLLPGWESSKGCRVEVALAILLGYRFINPLTGQDIERPQSVTISTGYRDTEQYDVFATDGPSRLMGST